MMLGVKVGAYLNLRYPLIRRLSCISDPVKCFFVPLEYIQKATK